MWSVLGAYKMRRTALFRSLFRSLDSTEVVKMPVSNEACVFGHGIEQRLSVTQQVLWRAEFLYFAIVHHHDPGTVNVSLPSEHGIRPVGSDRFPKLPLSSKLQLVRGLHTDSSNVETIPN